MPSLQIKRGTRAQLNAAAGASQLKIGEPYLITDENRIAVGLSATTYETYAKESEAGGGGGGLTTGSSEISLTGTINRLTVTGQAGVTAGSKVMAWLGSTTADNDAETHILASGFLGVVVSNIVPGTGFTLNILNEDDAFTGLFQVHWSY